MNLTELRQTIKTAERGVQKELQDLVDFYELSDLTVSVSTIRVRDDNKGEKAKVASVGVSINVCI